VTRAVALGFIASTVDAMKPMRAAPDADLEMDLIREFAVGGALQIGLNARDRREHIRVAIYRNNLVHKPFRDSGFSYASIYEHCFGTPIEMRSAVRTRPKADPPS
jgi:hypothetical protein